MIDLLFAALPIIFLLVAMTKPHPVPSTIAFAIGAFLAGLIAALYFQTPLSLLSAGIIAGLLDALTPISIVFGAIFFFLAMERSGALHTLQNWLRDLSPNPVAQIMIAGFSFIFLIEAAAGFGTPAALAAPILVALGFPAIPVAVLCLVFNTIPTAFGAVGTPVWFGFELLDLPHDELLAVGAQAAFLQTAAACVVPVLAMRLLVDWQTIRKNLLFIYLSIGACVLPMLLVAPWSYEFPAMVGGILGLPATILLARWKIGLEREKSPEPKERQGTVSKTVLLASLPLLCTLGYLLLSRIPGLGLRHLLTLREPSFEFSLGPLGDFHLSPALVVQVRDILGEGLNWSHAILYVPSLLPFVLAAVLAALLAPKDTAVLLPALTKTLQRLLNPVLALFGALVFVKLLMVGGETSATMVLGLSLAEAAGETWKFFAPFLGALGSFFSGSTTISNLTFGPIQTSIAAETGTSATMLLALQLSGAAMGNMICIHNIVAVCAVLGLKNREGEVLRKAFLPTIVFGAVLALTVAIRGDF